MTKKNKFIIQLLVFFYMLCSTFLKAQDTTEYYHKLMRRHWICSSGNVGEAQIYIPFESPLAKDVGPDRKFGGFTFKEGSNYQRHSFRMCGNDNGPSFYSGTWDLTKVNTQLILYMSEEYGEIKKYDVLELTDERMILVLKR